MPETSASSSLVRFTLQTFIDNTSLRGVRKCHTNRHRVLRLHWFVYLLSMTTILVYGSYDLLREYLEYHTSYQIEEKDNDPTRFPSITVCSMYPFTPLVASAWSNKSVLSPADVSRQLRHGMGSYIKKGMYTAAGSIFHSDRVSTYFQMLNQTELAIVEHKLEDLVPFCSMRHSSGDNPNVAHSEPCQFDVRRIHHPDFFTCYNLQLPLSKANSVIKISLVLSNIYFRDPDDVNASDLTNHQWKTIEHVYNLFNQGSGFRIALHEPDTYPMLEVESFSVQMQTSTQIRYRAMSYVKDGVLKNECADNVPLTAVKDVNETFKYTRTACLNGYIGRHILEQCGCVSAFHLRPRLPTPSVPYCGYFDEKKPRKFLDRLECVRSLNLTQLLEGGAKARCPRRCSQQTYESHMSSSDWELSMSQFHWLSHVTRELSLLQENPLNTTARDNLLRFAELKSVQDTPELKRTQKKVERTQKNMAMVKVSRLNYRTVVSREKLQLTLSALWSRLGGMGSLTIGVTLTFAFELVELLYLIGHRMWKSIVKSNSDDAKNFADKTGDQSDASISLQFKSQNASPKEVSNKFTARRVNPVGIGQEDGSQYDRQPSFYDNVPI